MHCRQGQLIYTDASCLMPQALGKKEEREALVGNKEQCLAGGQSLRGKVREQRILQLKQPLLCLFSVVFLQQKVPEND